MNLHQLSPRHRSESAFALSKRRVQALRDLPCNLWYTMSSRKQAEGFQEKGDSFFVASSERNIREPFFLKQEKVGFKSLAQLTSYIYI